MGRAGQTATGKTPLINLDVMWICAQAVGRNPFQYLARQHYNHTQTHQKTATHSPE